MKPLSLSLAGRGEDNAAHGGQVAHISAAEAELLKRLGGAGSINPITGLPEYMFGGFTYGGPPGASLSPGSGGAVATSGRGRAASLAPQGLLSPPYGLTSSRGGPSSSTSVAPPPPPPAPPPAQLGGPRGNVSAITTPAEAAAIAITKGMSPTMYGLEGPGGILGTPSSPSPGSGFGVVTTTDGTPVTTTEGIPVMHANLSGRVANTPITKSDIATAKFFNQLGEATEGIPNMVLAFLSQMARAQTPQNVASTRGALAIAGPSMGSPSATFGGPGQGGLLPSQYARPQISYGGYTPPAKSAIAQLVQSAAPQTVPATTQDPVVSTAPVNTAPVTALLQVDPEEEGFSPAVQRIRQLFFESLA